MTNKNHKIYSNDLEFLKRIAEEQKNYIGRDYKLDLKNGVLTILALPRRYKAKKENIKKQRDQRGEKFERRAS